VTWRRSRLEASSLGSADSTSDLSGPVSESPGKSSETPTLGQCSPGGSLKPSSTATCEQSAQATFRGLTFSRAASPAKTSRLPARLPARGPDSMASEADSGESLRGWPLSYDPASSSWRTCQRSALAGLDVFSETFPLSGTMRSGKVYQRVPLVPPSYDGGSTLWPTPTASTSNLGERPASWLRRRRQLVVTAGNSNGAGMPLTVAVKLYPHGPLPIGWQTEAVCSAALDSAGQAKAVGELNPEWAEWLMGFPVGWTDCTVSGTRLSPKWPSSSRKDSPPQSDDD
jgi:hypothetical protein